MTHKDAHPLDTIKHAKEILQDLGINVSEQIFSHSDVSYSCRISISTTNLAELNIGTNGKGTTPEYALASGYAELMERLQNKMLINEGMRYVKKIHDVQQLPFRFFPDESIQHSKWSDFITMIRNLFPRMISQRDSCNDTSDYEKSEIQHYSAPYADLTNNTIIQIPIIISRIPGSTGMCAGNTPAEAILQGLCEVYERYILQLLFSSPFSPPRFPKSYFANTEAFRRLTALKYEGYQFEICDLSVNGMFPVVGLILTDTKGHKMLRLGSDLDADIALQRCITETFQGENNAVDNSFINYEIPEENEHLFDNKRRNFFSCLHNGTGRYFDEVINGNPKNPFSAWKWTRSGSSVYDLINEIRRMKQIGLRLLVRDNSFLGFCAYHVVVPGLSELAYNLSSSFDNYLHSLHKANENLFIEDTHDIWPLYNPSELINANNLKTALVHIENNLSRGANVKLVPWNISPSNCINRNLLYFMICHKGNDWISASMYMERFIHERELAGLTDNDYFKCIVDEIRARYNAYSKKFSVWDDTLKRQVCTDLKGNIMRNFRFPTCFNCNRCPIDKTCRFRDLIDLERRIQQRQLNSSVDQTKLMELFNNQTEI